MSLEKQQELRQNLEALQAEHHDMERIIEEEQQKPLPDQIFMQRHKRRKLQIKEQVIKIENELLPDIIA